MASAVRGHFITTTPCRRGASAGRPRFLPETRSTRFWISHVYCQRDSRSSRPCQRPRTNGGGGGVRERALKSRATTITIFYPRRAGLAVHPTAGNDGLRTWSKNPLEKEKKIEKPVLASRGHVAASIRSFRRNSPKCDLRNIFRLYLSKYLISW